MLGHDLTHPVASSSPCSSLKNGVLIANCLFRSFLLCVLLVLHFSSFTPEPCNKTLTCSILSLWHVLFVYLLCFSLSLSLCLISLARSLALFPASSILTLFRVLSPFLVVYIFSLSLHFSRFACSLSLLFILCSLSCFCSLVLHSQPPAYSTNFSQMHFFTIHSRNISCEWPRSDERDRL
jgi:hypothetical protein